jgi:hypothetical protein
MSELNAVRKETNMNTTNSPTAQAILHVAAVHNVNDTLGALARAVANLSHIKHGAR